MENTLENLTEKSVGINLTNAFDQMLFPFKNTLEKAKAVAKVSQLKKVYSFFDNLTLKLVKTETDYWDNLTVTSDAERFNRWVFAIMSVHTTWESNVRGYNVAMKDLSWTIDKNRLEEMVVEARVGMYERRNKGLWQLAQKFRENPDQFKKQDDETWQECRDRLIGEIFGLGIAKTTFALNLSFPMEAEVCCLDIHLLRFLGYVGESPSFSDYRKLENEWLERCEKYGVSASVSREIYWNKVQNRRNSRYWSYCLEN